MRKITYSGFFIFLITMLFIACSGDNSVTPEKERPKDYSKHETNVKINGVDHFLQGWYSNNREMITDPNNQELEMIIEAGYDLIYQKLGVNADGSPIQQDLNFLDKCQQNEVYVLVDYLGATTIQKVAQAYGDHPAIFAYNLQDDANSHASPQEVLEKHYEMKTIVPNVTTIVSVFKNYHGVNSYSPEAYVRSADVMGYQTYPIDHWALDPRYSGYTEEEMYKVVDSELDYLQIANQGQRPILPNPQTFPWVRRYNDQEQNPLKVWRVPTPLDYRNITYSGIINGAKGIINYSLREIPTWVDGDNGQERFEWKVWEDIALWEECKKVVQEVNQIKHFLLGGKRAKLETKNEWVSAAYWNVDGQFYLIINNLSRDETQSFGFSFPAEGTLVNVFESNTNESITLSDYTVKGELAAGNVVVFKVE